MCTSILAGTFPAIPPTKHVVLTASAFICCADTANKGGRYGWASAVCPAGCLLSRSSQADSLKIQRWKEDCTHCNETVKKSGKYLKACLLGKTDISASSSMENQSQSRQLYLWKVDAYKGTSQVLAWGKTIFSKNFNGSYIYKDNGRYAEPLVGLDLINRSIISVTGIG